MKKIFILSIWFFCVIKIYAQSITCPKESIFLPGSVPCIDGDYYLSFEDNFDGNSLDLTKWNPITGVPRDNNFEQQKAWHLPENIEVSNGTLKIISKKLSTPYTGTWVSDWGTNPHTTKTSTFDYTTGEIWSNKVFDYGKYEIRCRIPKGKGFWPAFWTFGGPGWNEIDIFELYGDDVDRFTCNVHHDYDGDGRSENCNYAQNNVANFTDWHTFTCIFDPHKITWLIDDGSTVRVFYRYSTLNGQFIECGEEIAYGTYFQEISFPMESMNIIMNTAIQSGSNAPDASTIFPGIFEIDYVRFYIKSEEVPCEGCLDHIVYENTNQLPTITRMSNYIQASNNVTVKNGQNVSFKSPSIELLPGFLVESGSHFEAVPEACNLLNYTAVPVNYIGHNAVGNQINKCINPIFTIEATGVIYYSFMVYSLSGELIYNSNGTVTSNHIVLWNTNNVASGVYEVQLTLVNCSDIDTRNINLSVIQGSCIMPNSQDVNSSQNKENIAETTTLSQEFLIYPNPANAEVNVFYSINNNSSNNSVSFIVITDINGKEIYYEQVSNNIGAYRKKIDTSHFPNGTYILNIFVDDERLENKFIISR